MQTSTTLDDLPADEAGGIVRLGACEETLEGVALVADVAGFTRLTDTLASSRPDGLEQVARRLEGAFADYFAVVERHGGRVGALAGDALVAVFTDRQGTARELAIRARDCAHDLLALGRGARADDRLLLHIGLAHGRLWFGAVPDEGSGETSEPVVGGPAVREAFLAAKASRAGQGIMAAGFAQVLGLPAPTNGTTFRVLGASLRDLQAPVVRKKPTTYTEVAQPAWSAELRNVACLFIRLLGFDEGQPGAWEHYRQALRWVHEVAGASKACGRLVVDEAGLTLVIVFGEPTSLRAELPEQAAKLAAALVQRLESGGFSIRAGMAFGRAFCGYIGAGRSRLLVTVGPCMNLAARLMDQPSPGTPSSRTELLVAGWPQARLDRAGLAQATAVLQLKGYGDPVHAIRLDRDKALATGAPLLFGRREEQERIDGLFARVAGGEGAALLIRGDAGMGKSALLTAVVARAREQHGLPVFIGESREADHALPYQPWRRILRAMLPGLTNKDQAGLRAALTAHLQNIGQSPALAPLLNGVFDAGIPETPHTEALVGKNRAEAILDLVFELVRHGVPGPTVLVFEDVHLADSPSVRLLDRVAHRLPTVLLILAARPSAQTSELIFRLSGARLEQLDLQPLTSDDIGQLVASRLPGGQVEAEITRLISESAEGNALFAQEYLVLLQESGRITLDAGRWRLSADGELARSPETVLATVGSRIHALPPSEQVLIKSAAVVGEAFTKEMLARVRAPGLPGGNLDAGLDRLERSGLISRTSSRGDSYRFSHAIIREAAYGLMLFEQKAAVHADVGRILEERYRREVNAVLPALVHHFDGARDDERVIRFGDLAATEALREGAYREAIDFLRLCLDAADRVPAANQGMDPRVRWHRQMSEASLAMGELVGMRASAEAALRAAGERPRRSRTMAKLQTGLTLLYRALPRSSVPIARPRPAPYWPIERELAQVNHQLGMSSFFRGERIWLAYYNSRALVHAERGGGGVQLAYGLALTAGALCLLGFHNAARRHLHQAVETADGTGDGPASAFTRVINALYFVGQGSWGEAVEHLDSGQRIALATGDRVNWCHHQAIRYWKHSYLGEDEQALAAAQGLLKAAEISGNRQHQSWAHKFMGLCHLRRGQVAEAVEHLTAARRDLIHHENLNEVVPVIGSLAAALDAQGRVDEASQLAMSLLARLQREGPTGHAVLAGCSNLALVLMNGVRRGDRSAATLSAVRAAVRIVERYSRSFPIGHGRAALLRGLLCELTGRPRQAVRQWRRGIEWAARYQMRPDLAALAELLPEGERTKLDLGIAPRPASERILAPAILR